jgi:cytochrome b561
MKTTEYHPFAKFLHWSVVGLVIIQFLTTWVDPLFNSVLARVFLKSMHISFGVLLFVLAVALLSMRFLKPTEKPMVTLQEKAAVAMQYALYFLIVAITFSGWVSASIRNISVGFANLFSLPQLYERGSQVGSLIAESHEFFLNVLLFLVIGHAGAALYHHYVLKDSILVNMLPRRRYSSLS